MLRNLASAAWGDEIFSNQIEPGTCLRSQTNSKSPALICVHPASCKSYQYTDLPLVSAQHSIQNLLRITGN